MLAPSLDQQLCFAVYSAGLAFNRAYKSLLEPLGLTYPQYLVMLALWSTDDRTVGALGEALFLESSTLTPLLKRLEAQGLVSRTRDPDDERQVRIRLTAAGRALAERAEAVPRCMLTATGLSADGAGRLVAEVGKLRDRLLAAEPGPPGAQDEGCN